MLTENIRLLGQKQRILLLVAQQTVCASCLHWFLLPPSPTRAMQKGPQGDALHAVDKRHSMEHGACQINLFESKSALCPGKKLYLITQGYFLQTEPEKWSLLTAFRALHPLHTWQEHAGMFRASSNNFLCLFFYMLTYHFLIDL